MVTDNQRHRRTIRLRDYDDATDGLYFVTVCTTDRVCLFGDVCADEMRLNRFGEIVAGRWRAIPMRFVGVTIDVYIVMPNHLHGIVVIDRHDAAVGEKHSQSNVSSTCYGCIADASPQKPNGTETGSLSAVFQSFKSVSTRKINEMRRTPGAKVWQRNYFEHIIRDELDHRRISEYIALNPSRWVEDRYYTR